MGSTDKWPRLPLSFVFEILSHSLLYKQWEKNHVFSGKYRMGGDDQGHQGGPVRQGRDRQWRVCGAEWLGSSELKEGNKVLASQTAEEWCKGRQMAWDALSPRAAHGQTPHPPTRHTWHTCSATPMCTGRGPWVQDPRQTNCNVMLVWDLLRQRPPMAKNGLLISASEATWTLHDLCRAKTQGYP